MSAPNAAAHQSSSQQVDPAIEKLLRETKSLKAKIDLLEAENKALKKSLYELSYIYSAHIGQSQHQQQHQRQGRSLNSTGAADEDPASAANGNSGGIAAISNHTSQDHGASPNNIAVAVGQLLSAMSASQQNQGSDLMPSTTSNGSDPSSRAVEAQLKNAADLIKAEEEGVRRLNMGSIVSRQDGSSKTDGRQFYLKNDLKGHQGAVYAVQYSPNGKFLATGSFDKTVRIWDGTTNQNELYVLKGHSLNISDLAWGHDSALLLSAAYDKTCKLWDVESGKLLDSFDGEGFVQCVRFHPQNNNVFFSGTTRNVLSMMDIRKDSNASSGSAITIKNDTMVNSIYVYHDGMTVISGDSSGYLKTWDMRTGKVLQSILNETTKKPISHIAVSKQRGTLDGVNLADTEEQESRWLAVNSYDNDIAGAAARRSGKVRGADGDQAPSILSDKDVPLESSLILASGSMDPYVYLFDVGAGDGQYDLLQKLSGHTDRVYDVDFHPIDHVLASGSADFSVKVWGRASKRKK
ncbi:hypothetical protein BGZ99_010096 [Dissophora globulifera]|uniref:WD40 repeat-like protein n=1 Tax=Dissophora globulifera TaxID=979702 RepID=A0A9P6RUZ4_9FUNG|nr:hypothetical protein BGZ99_010096 [Dissophora globulifera]